MKTLIFSDTHLTNRFEPEKYVFLKKIISSTDKVIINGDFWDGLSITFQDFIESKWRQLFPLLKQKQTVYIYGNHDLPEMCDWRVNLFSVKQANEYYAYTNPKKLIIRHGHQYTSSIQKVFKNQKTIKILNNLHEELEYRIIKTFGRSFFRYGLYRSFTNSMHRYARRNMKDGEVLVCGHSHNAVFKPEKKYINSGLIRHGLAQYLLIENKKIRLVEEKY
jgi:predicted phosphodiesterase